MRLPTHSSGHSPAAFTLVELMVVIVLVAIMSALILPEMAGTYADAKLKSTARRLITLCSFANSQAISHNQTQRIRFDQQGRRFRLEAGSSVTAKTRVSIQRRSTAGDIETEGEWDPSIRLRIQEPALDPASGGDNAGTSSPAPPALGKPTSEAEGTALVFFADGTAVARQVSLEDPSGFRLVLDINATTSRVRIADTRRP